MLVGELGGGNVQDPRDETFVDQRLHRLPAVAGCVEHQDLAARALECQARALDARRGDAEHRGCHQRFVASLRFRAGVAHEPGHGARGLGEDRSADPVDSRDVDDRVEHEDVFVADKLPHHAGGQGTHHDFRHAEWQRLHRGRADRRSSRAAEGEDARDFILRVRVARKARRTCGRGRDGLTAVSVPAHEFERRAPELEDVFPGNLRRYSRASKGSDVDDSHGDAPRAEQVADESGLVTLCVECGKQQNRGHVDAHYIQ